MYRKEFEYVIAISNIGNISNAAKSLNISQPALSKYLQKIESDIGTKLFQRVGNKLILTYAGECYVDNVRNILDIENKMLNTINDIAKMDKGRIRIGIPSIRSSYVILTVIPMFKNRYSAIDLALYESKSDELETKLENCELDIIAVNTLSKNPLFEYEKIADEEFVLAVSKDNPLLNHTVINENFKYPIIDIHYLNNEKFIMLPTGHRIRQFADTVLYSHKIESTISMQTRSLESALKAVSSGLGITFTPEVNLKFITNHENIRYLSLDVVNNKYEFNLVYRKGFYITKAMSDLLSIFKANYIDGSDK